MTKIAVILSGSGYLDGTAVREAVIALLALDRAGVSYQCFAPDIKQMHVVNHITGEEEAGQRNVLVESARIARGDVKELGQAKESDFDAIIMPGGFGMAKNLSDIAVNGKSGKIYPPLQSLLKDFWHAKKPIGAICISPAILTAALADNAQIEVTIGSDADGLIDGLGGKHKDCHTSGYCVDLQNKVVSCPAYMSEDPLKDVADGIEKLVAEIINMAK